MLVFHTKVGSILNCHEMYNRTKLTDNFFAADIISCVEFNHDGELLATGDKGGRVVIFHSDASVSVAVV